MRKFILLVIVYLALDAFGYHYVNAASCHTLNVSGTNVSCNGQSNGTATVAVSGGSGSYSYDWSNGGTAFSISGLTAGIYSVNVLDNVSGCLVFDLIVITEPDLLTSSTSQVNVNCFGQASGSIDLSVLGGTLPYSYAWSNGPASQDIIGLAANTYNVTVTDNKGCTTTNSATITQPSSAVDNNISGTNISCAFGSDGAVDLTVWGGTTPYVFSWNSGELSEDLAGKPAGPYNVTVTDAKGCTTNNSLVLSEPTVVGSTISSTDIACFGQTNGSVDLSPFGGTTPYSFAWENSTFSLSASTEDLFNLSADTYSVTITDNNGCLNTSSATIFEPLSPLSTSISGVNVSCFGNNDGSINLTVSGGTSPYTFNWSNGMPVEDPSNIIAGQYFITITDSRGCTSTDSMTITEPSLPVSSTILGTNVSCAFGSDGNIDLTPTGGTAPYTFSWNGGTYITEDLIGVPSGTYNIVINDNKGCSSTDGIIITEPPVLMISNIVTPVNCFGESNGAINLTTTGGTSPYTYEWASSTVFLSFTSEDILNIIADTYSYIATDAKGCSLLDTLIVSEPPLLSSSITGVNINCAGGNDGSVNLTPGGGTLPYTFAWVNSVGPLSFTSEDLLNIPAEVYVATITDANNCATTNQITLTQPGASLTSSVTSVDVSCLGGNDGSIDLSILGGTPPYSSNWSNSATTEDISDLFAGTYLVTIVDTNGCTTTNGATINEPLSPLQGTLVVTNVNCFGETNGAIDLTATGGTNPYSFYWVNSTFVMSAVAEDLSTLPADYYSVVITDGNGCTFKDTVEVVEPPLLTGSIVSVDVNCFGGTDGSIDFTLLGGTLPYGISWSNGPVSEDQPSVGVGGYSVSVIDDNGCSFTDSTYINQPSDPLFTAISTENATCFGVNDGSIDLFSSGGTVPYTFQWSSGAITQNLMEITAGVYLVTVMDNNNCVIQDSAEIFQPDFLGITYLVDTITCNGLFDGNIDITVTGGTQPYSYSWVNSDFILSATTEDINGFNTDTYTVTVTDSLECSNTSSIVLPEPLPLVSSLSQVDVTCFDGDDGSIALISSGGNPAYTYAWSNGSTNQNPTLLVADTYSVTITDRKSCQTENEITVGQPSLIIITFDVTEVSCVDQRDGEIATLVSGGMGGFEYTWSTQEITSDITELIGGNYSLNVTDIAGCEMANETFVPTSDTECINIPSLFTPNGDGKNDTWVLRNLHLYENASVQVFNRWGEIIYEDKGTNIIPWDGASIGATVPSSTYYYIVQLGEGYEPKTGPLTIIK